MLAQIMLACVTNDENYDRILIQSICYTQRCREVRPGRAAAKDSFQSSQQPRHLKRFAVRHVDNFVYILDVHIRRHDLLTNSLDQVWSCFNNLSRFFVRLENRAIRIGADNTDMRIFLFQKSSRARDRAACSEAGDEMSDF